ncbi:MAG TPA: alpha/beta fold hydrolase [Kofleriaceae bacterium]|nr:alpha/beta fold hydrolase [Kofleriaceae bacterium]
MKPLPRRAFLGAELPPDDEAFSPSGTRISAVTPGGMADRADVRAGDTIVTLADLPVRTFAELAAALRRAGAAAEAEIRYARGATVRVSATEVAPCPLEEIEGVGVGYGELATGGVRLRTIATRVPEPRAVILALPDLPCESVEAESPLADLAHGLARAGFDTLRFDRRGVGDSEGGPCGSLDFSTECADAAAALTHARTRAREREVPLVVFGHGAGGVIAAQLAGEHHVHGIITYGTPAARLPAGPTGRSAAYHAQLDAIDPDALWGKVHAPVLVVRGEHDWVIRAEDQARIASLVVGTASVIDLPGLDHALGWHDSRAASERDYGAGRFDAAIVRRIAGWIDRL